jgi:hypothetical protein
LLEPEGNPAAFESGVAGDEDALSTIEVVEHGVI